MYNMTVWGSRIKPGREEFHDINESELKALLWDRFPGGFEINERKDGYWILRDEERVGEIIGGA